jgi:hypothetical protein
MRHPLRSLTWAGVLLALVLTSCGDGSDGGARIPGDDSRRTSTTVAPVLDPGDRGSYAPVIDPADFVDQIDHPYLPLRPGNRWVYEGTDGDETEHIEVEVTLDRREVFGISAVVVRDTVTMNGQLVEDTYDWFAQDREGNVWYLGEETAEYEDGEVVSTEGSWEAGVDGALPGIVMPAAPAVGGAAYRQEYLPGEAEDMGQTIRVGETATVAAGRYADVVVTREWTPLEPEVVEEKSYAPGVGLVLEVKTAGGEGRVELVSFS